MKNISFAILVIMILIFSIAGFVFISKCNNKTIEKFQESTTTAISKCMSSNTYCFDTTKTITMKHLIIAFVFIGIITSCNTTDKSKTDKTAPLIEVKSNINYKAIDTDEALIATALLAAPEESRAGSKVIGYNMKGEFVTFREGTNEFIVLVDNAKQNGFNAACYHKDLELFMARGRALKAEGKNRQEAYGYSR